MTNSKTFPHPLVLVLLPFPAIWSILLAKEPYIPLTFIVICSLCSLLLGLRTAGKILGAAVVTFCFISVSFWPWLGLHAASMLAVRMASLLLIFVVPLSAVRWPVLTDTLIQQFKIPYPLVDAITLGGRFHAVMRRECSSMATQLRVDARGSRLKQLVMSRKLVIPLLVASFRHADTTALALENRQFASSPTRTTHHEQHVQVFDWLALATIWAAMIAVPYVAAAVV